MRNYLRPTSRLLSLAAAGFLFACGSSATSTPPLDGGVDGTSPPSKTDAQHLADAQHPADAHHVADAQHDTSVSDARGSLDTGAKEAAVDVVTTEDARPDGVTQADARGDVVTQTDARGDAVTKQEAGPPPPACAPTCPDDNTCNANPECGSGICTAGKCATPACSPTCPDRNPCGAAADCASAVCTAGECAPPACSPACVDGNVCGNPADCASGVCTSGKCAKPSCAPTCPDDNVCGAPTDCGSGVCTSGKCAAPACSPTCADGTACGGGADCGSGVCTGGLCAAPTCSPACPDGNACGGSGDCASNVCTSAVCAVPTCSPTCGNGNVCGAPGDCASGVCTNGKCAAGSCAPGCPDGKACGASADCASGVCIGSVCKAPACAPTCSDGNVCGANGDCGSDVCAKSNCAAPACSPSCPATNPCGANADCASDVCTVGFCAPPHCSPTCGIGVVCGTDGDCASGLCTAGKCAAQYAVSVTLTGLATAASIVLTDNGTDNLTLTANGTSSFSKQVVAGGTYAVTVSTPPAGQFCYVHDASGTATAAVSLIVDCRTGLIAYYPFDEGSGTTILDVTGNGNNGAHNGTYTAGVVGDALALSGNAEGATVIGNALFTWGAANADYTVDYWVWVTALQSNWTALVHKTLVGGGDCCSSYDRSPAHFLSPGGLLLYPVMGTVDNGNEYETSSTLKLGTWTHIAAVHSGAQQIVYVNGAVATTESLSSATVGGQGTMFIGYDTYYGGLNGKMDELRIYNRALVESEVVVDATH